MKAKRKNQYAVDKSKRKAVGKVKRKKIRVVDILDTVLERDET